MLHSYQILYCDFCELHLLKFKKGLFDPNILTEGITMIFFITALYCEALPLIDLYQLKKDITHTKLQVFRSDTITLIITKPGLINAAMGVTYLLSTHNTTSKDILVNLGVCGSNFAPVGNLYLCNKIVDSTTKQCFYPDLIYQHPFGEAMVESHPMVVKHGNPLNVDSNQKLMSNPKDTTLLIDMEASAIYQAAILFLQPHQIQILKVVSDHLEEHFITADHVSNLIKGHGETIASWIDRLQEHHRTQQDFIFTEDENTLIKEIEIGCKFSVTMGCQLRQLLTYYKLQTGEITPLLTKFLVSLTQHPCKSKKEGKRYLEQLKQEIL